MGADRGYDAELYVDGARAVRATPYVAVKTKGGAIDGRTTRHAGYAVGQRKREAIEVFGWLKAVAGLRKLRHRGTALVDWLLTLACSAYNLARVRRLLAAEAAAGRRAGSSAPRRLAVRLWHDGPVYRASDTIRGFKQRAHPKIHDLIGQNATRLYSPC